MKISIYIHKIIYKFGGTESFTAKFLEITQDLYPAAEISLITEVFKKRDGLTAQQMIERLNGAYGTSITSDNFSVRYINAAEPKPCRNIVERILRKCNAVFFQKKLCTATKCDDLFVNCSNQSVIGSAARNITIIHFPQDRKENSGIYKTIPFLKVFARKNDLKYFHCYEYFLPNSQFTAYWLKQKWQIPSERICVCYPPITLLTPVENKNMFQIFACGRIEASKKIDVMIKAFNSSEYLVKNCTFIVAGSCDNEDTKYIDYIKSISGNNIRIIQNPSRVELENLYAESGIFWHAKGYGETNPMLMEHFGMTTVEAMSAGCIPVVINKGGQKEIVTQDCGYTWDEPEQLVSHTEQLLKNSEKIAEMRKACIERSKICSKESFKKNIQNIFALR